MPDRAGTLERITLKLGSVLTRVPSKLRGDGLPETLAELGIQHPEPIPAGITSAADVAATAAEAVPGLLTTLIKAVQAGDDLNIVGTAIELVARCGQVLQGFVTLAGPSQDRRRSSTVIGPIFLHDRSFPDGLAAACVPSEASRWPARKAIHGGRRADLSRSRRSPVSGFHHV